MSTYMLAIIALYLFWASWLVFILYQFNLKLWHARLCFLLVLLFNLASMSFSLSIFLKR